MLSLSRFQKMTAGKDLKKDVFCYLFSDNFKVVTSAYEEIKLNTDTECIELYRKDSKGNKYLYLMIDVEQVISIQFLEPNLDPMTKNMIESGLRGY